MDLIATAYITVIFLGFALVLMLGVYSLRFLHFPGGRQFLLYILFGFIAIFAFGLLSISHTAEQAFIWARLRFLGFAYSSPVFLLFVWDYTGKKFPYQRQLSYLIFIIPTITQIIIWSSAVIPGFFTEWSTVTYSFLLVERSRFGFWSQVHLLHAWIVLILAYYFAIASLTSSKGAHRQALVGMLLANLIATVVASIPSVTGNLQSLNLTPIGITIALLISGWVLVRHHLFDLLTGAAHTVFQSLQDGVLVLNGNREIIQWNPAAQTLLGKYQTSLMYQPVSEILAENGILEPLPLGAEMETELTINRRTYNARLSTLRMSNGFMSGELLVMHDITDYRTAEAARHESEKLYRLLADNSSDMIVLNSLDGRFLYASPSCRHTSGYSEQELLALNAVETAQLVYPDDVVASQMYFGQIASGQVVPPLEFRLLRKDGSIFWCEVRAQPITDAGGHLTHVMSVFRNIEERKRVEFALRESNQRYDTLVANIPAMVFQVRRSLQGKYQFDFISPTARKYIGLEPEAVIDNFERLFSLLEPPVLESMLHAQEESARNLTQFVWEGTGVIDGHAVWRHIESMPTRLDDGTVIWNGVMLDITAQKQAELALERTRKMLEQITHMLPDVIQVFDVLETKPIYYNRSIPDLLGYEDSDHPNVILGANPSDILSYSEDYAVESQRREQYPAMRDGEVIESETRWRHKTRGLVWLNTREMVYERTSDGRVKQILSTVRDVTERKVAEEQRQKLLAQLEAANQELKDFAYVISHDLRAPLRGVSSITHWLVTEYSDRFDDESKELIDLLGGRVRRMEQMISGVLEYSRIGREKAPRREVNTQELVAQLIQDIVPGEHITVTVTPPLPNLYADETRIRQVFQNLIDNAVKFMDKPYGEICISCQQEGRMWHFTVRDNGPGIAAEHFERVFQLFQTLNPKDKFESTGVGLSLTKRIIEMYSGKIWLESVECNGATFHFTLPVA